MIDPERQIGRFITAGLELYGYFVHEAGDYQLLHLLACHVGLVISHSQLIRENWGDTAPNNVRYLRTLMRKLRQKLALATPHRNPAPRAFDLLSNKIAHPWSATCPRAG
jgi:hypothetical protein